MQENSQILLSAKNLSHSFDYPLFHDIDIAIHKKESIAILGVSGSGKSTLLHILATLLKPQKGSVTFEHKNMYTLKDKQLLEIRRNQIGIIFQSHYLFKGFSVLENLKIYSLISKKRVDTSLIVKIKITIYFTLESISRLKKIIIDIIVKNRSETP